MKTLKNIIIGSIATIIVTFVTLAVLHVIHLTEAGVINWNN